MADKLSKKDKLAYKQFFQAADQDGDGKIDYDEFDELTKALGESYPPDTLRDIFDAADRDGNNRIDFDEFVKITPDLPAVSDIYLKEFKKMDVDGNGQLSKQELQYAIMSMGRFIKISKVEEMIEKVDINNDGKINYLEFLKMLPDLY